MQVIYRCDCTGEEYVTRGLWLKASLPACGYCQPKGLECRPVHHGYYRRLTPARTLVKRYLCTRTGRTISLLPECLASHWQGSVDAIERASAELDRKACGEVAREVAAEERFEKCGRPRESARNWVSGCAVAVAVFLLGMRTLFPDEYGSLRTVSDFRQHLGTQRALVALRRKAGDQLQGLGTPIGLRRRPINAVRGREAGNHTPQGGGGPPCPGTVGTEA